MYLFQSVFDIYLFIFILLYLYRQEYPDIRKSKIIVYGCQIHGLPDTVVETLFFLFKPLMEVLFPTSFRVFPAKSTYLHYELENCLVCFFEDLSEIKSRVLVIQPSIVWEYTQLGDILANSGSLKSSTNITVNNMFFSSLPDLEVESSVSIADAWKFTASAQCEGKKSEFSESNLHFLIKAVAENWSIQVSAMDLLLLYHILETNLLCVIDTAPIIYDLTVGKVLSKIKQTAGFEKRTGRRANSIESNPTVVPTNRSESEVTHSSAGGGTLSPNFVYFIYILIYFYIVIFQTYIKYIQ